MLLCILSVRKKGVDNSTIGKSEILRGVWLVLDFHKGEITWIGGNTRREQNLRVDVEAWQSIFPIFG